MGIEQESIGEFDLIVGRDCGGQTVKNAIIGSRYDLNSDWCCGRRVIRCLCFFGASVLYRVAAIQANSSLAFAHAAFRDFVLATTSEAKK